ncbi:MAG: hypothetical protein AABY10_01670, partial [Nanoarchaeota archaeon]
MFFDKNKSNNKCEQCNGNIEKKYSFCPFCGDSLIDIKKQREDYGLIGKNDLEENNEDQVMQNGLGITDKLINSVFNSMLRSLDKQFQNQIKNVRKEEKTEIMTFPNGIKIKISGPFQEKQKLKQKKPQQIEINESLIRKINSLPKEKAKTSMKRIGNRVLYELKTPGLTSPHDVLVSKLESGYEIKAVGDKKVYVNSI